MVGSLSSLVLFLALGPQAFAQDWPRFRGPNGSGRSTAEALPTSFDATSEAWRAELPPSHSSPIVVGGLVIACTSAKGELAIHAFDARSGVLRWRLALERARTMAIYEANDSACPTPTSDGRSIFAFFPELGLVACDLEGRELWGLPLGPFLCFYGLASSPIVAGYDLRDGKELWRKGRFPYAPISSPLVEGERIYVCAPAQVEERMPSFEAMKERHDANGDAKLAPQELGSGGWAKHFGWIDADRSDEIAAEEWTTCAEAMANADHGLAALVRSTGTSEAERSTTSAPRGLWRHKRPLPSIASPLLLDGVVYLLKDGGILSSIDAASGELRKSERLRDASGAFWASPIAADGRLYLAEHGGMLFTVRAGAAWELEARSELDESIFGTPAIAHGAIYLRTENSLRCYRRPTKD